MNAAFYTLGCKVNQYESQAMVEALRNSGFEIVSSDSEADVYIVNSCTVTTESDRKTKQAVRHFKRLHPDSVVVLTGCMPQSYPQIASELNEADIVLGNASNDRVFCPSCGNRRGALQNLCSAARPVLHMPAEDLAQTAKTRRILGKRSCHRA